VDCDTYDTNNAFHFRRASIWFASIFIAIDTELSTHDAVVWWCLVVTTLRDVAALLNGTSFPDTKAMTDQGVMRFGGRDVEAGTCVNLYVSSRRMNITEAARNRVFSCMSHVKISIHPR
jgi:hypothetical protein